MQTQGLAAFSGRTAISGSTGVSASESRKESKSGPFPHHGSILTARGESPASHRGRRGAPMTRRDDREYREYLREEQRSQRGCIAGRMQLEFHRGLLSHTAVAATSTTTSAMPTASPPRSSRNVRHPRPDAARRSRNRLTSNSGR